MSTYDQAFNEMVAQQQADDARYEQAAGKTREETIEEMVNELQELEAMTGYEV